MRISSLLAVAASLAALDTTVAFTFPSTSVGSVVHRHGRMIAPSCIGPNKCPAWSSRSRLFMSWGPAPEWTTASVSQNIQACPSGSCVSLKVDVVDGSGFVLPGQYVQVRPTGGEFVGCSCRLRGPLSYCLIQVVRLQRERICIT